ncbi:UvrD-helicase domain-containing protein [Halorussus pelagicus]|uniref:UvrD-helicase domain-containing protein n=1 Tax=Halorussus pelagicus TaxID=2505977 RepID=UPI000FFBC881|nr:UvrD-helicase domain-containing protein [Halorussus pelagicus]
MSEGPIRLAGAQRAIRDAYFDHDSGLFALDCVPGSGKSVVAHHVAAEDVLRRYADGDRTPAQHVAVVSFNRDEAADIVPSVCERLRELVEHDLVPAAEGVTEAELSFLIQRVRRAPFAGTIDSLLHDVLQDIARAVGFEETPAVGNDALLKRVHAECYERVRTDPDYAGRLDRLEAAYPDDEYEDDPADMLERAVAYCRNRRLSTPEFAAELERTVETVYAEGPTESFADIAAAIDRCVGGRAGDRPSESASDDLDAEERARAVAADQRLHDEWRARVEDFRAVLDAYRRAYRENLREYAVVSHTDAAYLVDRYFEGKLGGCDDARERLRERYAGRIRSLLVDEAQDVSAVQHAALSHLVGPDARVFVCGDTLQSIYRWRHADPTLFESAVADGEYLGVDWDTHESRTATTTYRCVPEIAAAIDAVARPIFTDSARGNVGDLDVAYPSLDPARDATDDASVHVASFGGLGSPGSSQWVSPDDGTGEADILARYLSKGLADGTFTDEDGDAFDITVLFRRGTRMSEYEAAFAAEELRVWNATGNLFDSPAVETVLAVCEWLVEPGDPERTAALVAESHLGLADLQATFESNDWDLDAVADEGALDDSLTDGPNSCTDAPDSLTDPQRDALAGLRRLRDRRGDFERRPAATYVEDVIEALALRADPHDRFGDLDARQRVADLDALAEAIAGWETGEQFDPRTLADLVAPFRENPAEGPDRPSAADTDHDVEFRTVHRAKGDESDVVVLADPGFDSWSRGPHDQRFVAQGGVAGLAPPTDADVPGDISLPGVGSLYAPAESDDDGGPPWGGSGGSGKRDAGLRWASARWCDTVTDAADRDVLVGPARLQRVAANERAELWRLLYVALTRARDHLVVALPRSMPDDRPRDRWLDAVRDGLRFADDCTESYAFDPAGDESAETSPNAGPGGTSVEDEPDATPVEVGVNDVDFFAHSDAEKSLPDPDVAVTPPRRDELAPWVPRFVEPSTMYQLTEDPDRYVLDHLLGGSLHTDAGDLPDDLPLRFDRLGPEAVGSCLHDVLTKLVVRGVSESALRATGEEVEAAFDEALRECEARIGEAERAGLLTFFEEYVLEDFLASDLWDRLRTAESVAVETPIDGLVEVEGVEVEMHGEADFVLELPSGERYVTDAKISLAETTPETRRRYKLQVAAYGYLFERESASSVPVHRTVETFGVTQRTVTSELPLAVVERRLSGLLDDRPLRSGE